MRDPCVEGHKAVVRRCPSPPQKAGLKHNIATGRFPTNKPVDLVAALDTCLAGPARLAPDGFNMVCVVARYLARQAVLSELTHR